MFWKKPTQPLNVNKKTILKQQFQFTKFSLCTLLRDEILVITVPLC